MAALAGGAANRFSLSRPELAATLIEGLDDSVDVRYACDVRQIRREDSRVDVLLGNEADSFDFVVGADGIHSRTRPPPSSGHALRSSGQVCWRGIVRGARGDTATEMWDGIQRVGVVALSQHRSYIYIVRTGTQETVSAEQLGLIGQAGTIREMDAIAAMQDLHPNEILFHELWELRKPSWGSGRVALLGDAAHAITPNLGLGAALAIEDGVVLASALRHGPEHATRRYRARRAARVRAIQLASRAIGIAAHSDHRAASLIRRQLGLQSAEVLERRR